MEENDLTMDKKDKEKGELGRKLSNEIRSCEQECMDAEPKTIWPMYDDAISSIELVGSNHLSSMKDKIAMKDKTFNFSDWPEEPCRSIE